jgi:mRNA interferase HigB
VNVIAPRTLREFWERHPHAQKPLRQWEKAMRANRFRSFGELQWVFPSADYVRIGEAEVVIFNIGGNKYRLVVSVSFEHQAAFIKRVMTHAEYDHWNRGGRPL